MIVFAGEVHQPLSSESGQALFPLPHIQPIPDSRDAASAHNGSEKPTPWNHNAQGSHAIQDERKAFPP
jgi:hypothetical protein